MSTSEIQLYNTLSAKKEKFKPRKEGEVNVYGCGPTVYGYMHVGNAMAAIVQDLLYRVFKFAGYKVKFARNVTDVDDKIIKAANEAGIDPSQLAKKYTEIYFSELKTLSVLQPTVVPLATEHIPDMLAIISELIKKGFAYEADTPYGKDVYFRVERFKDYGKLSKRKTDELLSGARIEPGEAKESPLDFALWKAAKPGEPSWESPWGQGRPGWHIECSAMIQKHFQDTLDIHMGGIDLLFPHHDNEIAQSECFNGKTLAPYWVHNNMLVFGREKMSKSLGNIFTVHKFLEQYLPDTLRLLVLQSHYRSPIDFSTEGLSRTEALLERLYTCKKHAQESQGASDEADLPPELRDLEKNIREALLDDMNTAKALGFILKAARLCFKDGKAGYWKAWSTSLKYFDEIYGILGLEPTHALAEIRSKKLKRLGVTEDYSKQIEARLEQREQFRLAKNFAESDRLRKELEAEGVVVMDGPDGVNWTLLRALNLNS